MMEVITKYFLTFIIISFAGWVVEELFALFISKEKVNRGFLVGPICPIYGFSAILMILLLNQFKDNILLLFLLSMIICAVLEYLTSYLLEKTLNIKLWNYPKSEYKYSIHGRITLETLIPFGLLGIAVIEFINPFIESILNKMNIEALYTIAIIIFIIGLIDLIFSIIIILKMDKNSKGDITKKKSEIAKEKIDNTTTEVRNTVKKTNDNVRKQLKNTSNTFKKSVQRVNDKVRNSVRKKSN